MRRIDSETVTRILDTANIVDVVSDFVSLKRRGANYTGLCPFHNERTPSFSVSPARNICKCFSCGKGGSPVNFIMEHEQMTYYEALRWLARKYNIEIKEQDVTDEERQRESARENMFAVNEFALKQFEKNMMETADGRDIGLAYFRERGISDAAIKTFHLGYALDRNVLAKQAEKEGYSEQSLVDTGLCIKRDDGSVYDRFRGRVIYPVHTISGKVVAFGGRTLRNDKKVAKYVNSPESIIYTKSRELYGLYQAKKSIVNKKKCILVEGYMDVISMSQLGVENVVASSGTSLTEGQIRLIHRYTEDVTVIYDSDAAGIKASLRGIDMLLAEGLNIKVVLLPDGDDPDSFAQSHSLAEVEQYLAENEVDFIRFKTNILLKDAKNDPTRFAQVINDVIESISVIPNEITRAVYVKECARMMEIDEKTILRQLKVVITRRQEKLADKTRRDNAIASIGNSAQPTAQQPAVGTSAPPADYPPADIPPVDYPSADLPPIGYKEGAQATTVQPASVAATGNRDLYPFEEAIVRYAVKYGMVEQTVYDETGSAATITVLRYLSDELGCENILLTNPLLAGIMDICREIAETDYARDLARFDEESLTLRQQEWEQGSQEIAASAKNLDQIKAAEVALTERINDAYMARRQDFDEMYISKRLINHPDDAVRHLATELSSSRYQLSKVHTKHSKIETERDRLPELLSRAIYGLKNAIITGQIKELNRQLRTVSPDSEEVPHIMQRITELDAVRREYASYLGERVVLPRR